jgi:phosphoribosyl 1,2-cyclic phosphate phosphodiesterase
VLEHDDGTRLLIDTPPELRLQLLRENVSRVDAVLYTHDHADHVHGIDDLRALSRDGYLAIYGSAETIGQLAVRFPYIFDPRLDRLPGISKPQLTPHVLEPGQATSVAGFTVVPCVVSHGITNVFGYRIGDIGYVTDVKTLSDDAIRILRGVSVLIMSALFERPHPSHQSIPEGIEVARAIGAARTYFTHLTHAYSHADLVKRLPPGIEPAWDGLKIDVSSDA